MEDYRELSCRGEKNSKAGASFRGGATLTVQTTQELYSSEGRGAVVNGQILITSQTLFVSLLSLTPSLQQT
jgi:hypothetical protein